MKPAIEYWRGFASSYGWPLDDPATGMPMDVAGLSFRVRVFLSDSEIVLPAEVGPGEFSDGKTIQHPVMLLLDIGPADLDADPGRYSIAFEVNDNSGWQVMPARHHSITVR